MWAQNGKYFLISNPTSREFLHTRALERTAIRSGFNRKRRRLENKSVRRGRGEGEARTAAAKKHDSLRWCNITHWETNKTLLWGCAPPLHGPLSIAKTNSRVRTPSRLLPLSPAKTQFGPNENKE